MHILEVAGLSPTWRRALLAGTKICGRLFVGKKLKWLIFFYFCFPQYTFLRLEGLRLIPGS